MKTLTLKINIINLQHLWNAIKHDNKNSMYLIVYEFVYIKCIYLITNNRCSIICSVN